MSDTTYLDWPFLEERHRVLARELETWAARHVPHHHGPDVDTACRALVRSLGEVGLAGPCGGRRGGCEDRHAGDLPHPRNAGAAQRPGGFRFRDAGAGLGRHQPAGHACAKGALPAARGARRGHRRIRVVGAERGLRRGGAAMQRPHRRRPCRSQRRKDLDFERRHRRFLRGVLPHRRSAGCARHFRFHRRCGHTRPGDRATHRSDRAAPAGAAAFCRLPRAAHAAGGCGGRRLQVGHANAGRVPYVGGGCRPRVRGAGVLDEALKRATTRRMFNQALSDFQLTQAKLAQMATTIDSSARC